MKKSFSGLGTRMSLLFAGVMAAVGLGQKAPSFDAPKSNPMRRSGKSSGGSHRSAPVTPEYKAWRKLFGGLAVRRYEFIDLDAPALTDHLRARGPRPDTFYKTCRA